MTAVTNIAPKRTVALLALVLTAMGPLTGSAQEAPLDEGLFVTVPNPITTEAVTRLEAAVQQAINRPDKPVKKVVFDFNPNGKEAATRDYGICDSLAEKIKRWSLNGVTTLAFVHNKVTGHTVLPVLACTELVMSDDARIGEIVEGNAPVPPDRVLNFYAELAGPGRAAIVLKMADKNIEVLKGLRGQTTVYLDSRKRDAPANRDIVGIDPVPVLPAGAVELYSAEQARTYGLAKFIAKTRAELADAYQISRASLRDDPLLGREATAWKIVVRGNVDRTMREALNRRFRYVLARGANIIVLQLECGGGDLTAAREIADDLHNLKDKDGNGVLTVAFIPEKAPDSATILALGCSDIVMAKGDPREDERPAEMGDFIAWLDGPRPDANNPPQGKNDQKQRPVPPPPGERISAEAIRQNLRELSELHGYPTVVFEGMVDKDLVLIRARGVKDATRRQVMSLVDFEQANRNEKVWIDEGRIKDKGQYLKLDAVLARQLGIARFVVDNRDINEVLVNYGLDPSTVKEATPDWLDGLADFLRRPEVSILLVVIGLAAVFLELKVPGLTVGGVTAAICFVLFFWAQSHMSGQISYLAILLFLLGLILVGVEIFILPGFGFTGITGIALTVLGLGLATVDKVPQTATEWGDFSTTLLSYGGSIVVAGILAMMIARFLPRIPYVNWMVLQPPSDEAANDGDTLPHIAEAATLLGEYGSADTVLRPAGMARFGDRYVDVVSEGGYIEVGSRIQVIEVEGSRVVVKQV